MAYSECKAGVPMLRALPLWRSRKSDSLSKVMESWERGMVAPLREGVAGNAAPGGGPWGVGEAWK